jgi:predicted O-linked N-acetylglucosamine transferase (SPINDLY family)
MDPAAATRQAIAHWEARDLPAAEAGFRAAIAGGSADAAAFHGLGAVLSEQGRMDEAVESLRLAVDASPDDARYRGVLGQTLARCGLSEEAVEHLSAAIALAPEWLELEAELHRPLMALCDWSGLADSMERLRRAADTQPAEQWTRRVSPWTALALPLKERMRRTIAVQHARRIEEAARMLARPVLAPRGERARLRIGYASADFHDHATAHLSAGLYEQHDRERFEVYAYSFGADDGSAYRRRLERGFDRFVDIRGLDAAAAAARIAADGIDILVDLKGYTAHARELIFALRPAPVQVSYLGFPGALQAPFIDYTVADEIVLPRAEAPECREAIAWLPDSYQVNDDRLAIPEEAPARAAVGLPESAFVFCSFNQTLKIEPVMFACWMEILTAVPDGVLWLLCDSDATARNLRAEAAKAGIDPERLVVAKRLPKAEHLARHRLADLFLDTRLCNAHTTAADALWAGLPVLTCRGSSFASRVGASLLYAVGLPELVTRDLVAYRDLAIALARDEARLGALRAKLAANRTTCPLFRTERFTRHIESAYERMWVRHREGGKPVSFRVAAA